MGVSFNPHPPPGVQLQATARHEERSKERAGEREAELPESGFVVIVLVCKYRDRSECIVPLNTSRL